MSWQDGIDEARRRFGTAESRFTEDDLKTAAGRGRVSFAAQQGDGTARRLLADWRRANPRSDGNDAA